MISANSTASTYGASAVPPSRACCLRRKRDRCNINNSTLALLSLCVVIVLVQILVSPCRVPSQMFAYVEQVSSLSPYAPADLIYNELPFGASKLLEKPCLYAHTHTHTHMHKIFLVEVLGSASQQCGSMIGSVAVANVPTTTLADVATHSSSTIWPTSPSYAQTKAR